MLPEVKVEVEDTELLPLATEVLVEGGMAVPCNECSLTKFGPIICCCNCHSVFIAILCSPDSDLAPQVKLAKLSEEENKGAI